MAAGSLNLGEIVRAQQGHVRHGLVLAAAAPPVRGVLHLRRGRDQPRALRRGRRASPRSWPASHGRVLRHGLRRVLPGRVRQHDPDLFLTSICSGRLALAVPACCRLLLAVPVLGWFLGDGIHWFLAKTAFFIFCFLWFRATFPRYRYDQIMRLGWKVFIPVTLVWLFVHRRWPWRWAGSRGRCKERPHERRAKLRQELSALELLKGMSLTGRYLFARKITRPVSRGEDSAVAPLPRPARAAPLSQRRGALHRLQAVRGGLPGACHHYRVRAARRRHAPHHPLRHRPVQVHLLRLLRGGVPGGLHRGDAPVRVPL
jgi:hypothetical protein